MYRNLRADSCGNLWFRDRVGRLSREPREEQRRTPIEHDSHGRTDPRQGQLYWRDRCVPETLIDHWNADPVYSTRTVKALWHH
jgi:hypothetical protein